MGCSRTLRRTAQPAAWAGLGVALALCVAGGTALAQLDEARVRRVASMTAEQPAGLGRPIADRDAWERLAAGPAWRDVVRRAERLLAEPLPETTDDLYLDYSRTGNRSRWEDVAWRRRSRVKDFALAECLEDRGRFLPALEQTIRAVCAERTWTLPAHDENLANFRGEAADVDLASSALAWELATADYLLGDRLSPEVRGLMRDNVRRRVLDPFREMATGRRRQNWWMTTTNNWNAVCLTGVTGAALAAVPSREERAFFIVASEECSRNFLKGFPPDGYCTEGLGYWNYGFGHYVMLGEMVRQATGGGVDLLAREEALAPAAYGAGLEIVNGIYPAFADCDVGAQPESRLMSFVSRVYGLGLGRYDRQDPAGPSGSLAEALFYSFPNSASEKLPAPARAAGLRTWFDRGGVLIGRPAPGSRCRLGVALKGGHNAEHHNHNDVGSYVVVVDGQAVLLDPGAEVYTARTFSSRRYESSLLNSWGHPVPVVAGRLQREGRGAQGRVLRAEFTDAEDTLVLDISSAYDAPGLKRLERTFAYSRAGQGSLTVTDSVSLAEPAAFGTALITLGRWREEAPGVLLIQDTQQAVRVHVRATGGEVAFQAEQIHEDFTTERPPTRVGVNMTQPVREATITVTVTPLDEGGPFPRNGGFEDGDWAWSIPKDGMGSISREKSAGGSASLRIVDAATDGGSDVSSALIPVARPGAFEVRGQVLPVSGEGVGVYVYCLAADGRVLNETDQRGWISPVVTLGGSDGAWRPFSGRFTAPQDTQHLRVWIHSFNASRVEAYLDNLEVAPLDYEEEPIK
jgi:hypothetical protein